MILLGLADKGGKDLIPALLVGDVGELDAMEVDQRGQTIVPTGCASLALERGDATVPPLGIRDVADEFIEGGLAAGRRRPKRGRAGAL